MGTHPTFNPSTGPDAAYKPKTTDEGDGTVSGGVVQHVNAQGILTPPVAGQVTIATTGTAVPLPNKALVNGVVVKAKSTNAAQSTNYTGAAGGSTVTTAYDGSATAGYPLAPGEAISFACANANQVYVNGTAGDVFSYAGG